VSKIEIGRYSELLRRQLGMKGQETVAGELSPEISPTFQLEGPSAEWDFLKAVRGGRCTAQLTPQVGFNSRFRLRNPQNSGVIAVVTLVGMTVANPSNVGIARGQIFAELSGAEVTVVPDLRWGAIGTTTTALIFSSDNLTAAGPGGDLFVSARIASAAPFKNTEEVVLIPGTNLDWGTLSLITNIGMFGWAAWRERQLPALEL